MVLRLDHRHSGLSHADLPHTKRKATMKHFGKLLMIAFLSATGCVSHAQERPLLKVNIPFDFAVENTNFSSGTYILSVLSPEHLMTIQSVEGISKAIFRYIPSMRSFHGPVNGKAVFHRIDGEYFLIQIWEPGDPTYQEILEGKHAQELANHQSSKALVAIAAR